MLSSSARVIFKPKCTSSKMLATTMRHLTCQCKLLIVGGGSGGVAMAAKFAKIMGKDQIILVEPNSKHYYQPMFTLIGGGIKQLPDSYKDTVSIIPKNVKLWRDAVSDFSPSHNVVYTKGGDKIEYEFMIVAMGLTLNYDKIAGCVEALRNPEANVCSIYSPEHVKNVYQSICKVKEGDAYFTFPMSPIKCPGAPQKICYLADHIYHRKNVRDNIKMHYVTTLPVIFGVEKYAKSLNQVAKQKNISVETQRNLVEIDGVNKMAVFEDLTGDKKRTKVKYSLLHVTPPQSTPSALKASKKLVNEAGFLDVDKFTLQHVKYSNIFGIGDCTNTPNSKTVAAVAAQSGVVYSHLKAAMGLGAKATSKYDGYASCPLVTGYNKCILAEFDYQLQPKETFPIDQSKESMLMYHMKKDFMPPLYWQLMLKGYWDGPGQFRQILQLGQAK